MYWNTGSRQTNGATANFGVGGFSSTATPVPVAAVSDNALVTHSGLIHRFSQQAHPIGAASGFANAAQFASPVSTNVSLGYFLPMHSRVHQTQFASPMTCMHDSLGFLPMHSRVRQVRSFRRSQTAFHPSTPAPNFADTDVPFSGGRQHLGHPPGTTTPQQFTHSGYSTSQMGS